MTKGASSIKDHVWYREMREACPDDNECWIFPERLGKMQVTPGAYWISSNRSELHDDRKVHARRYVFESLEPEDRWFAGHTYFTRDDCDPRCVNPAHCNWNQKDIKKAGGMVMRADIAEWYCLTAIRFDDSLYRSSTWVKRDMKVIGRQLVLACDVEFDQKLFNRFVGVVKDVRLAGDSDLLWVDRARCLELVDSPEAKNQHSPIWFDECWDMPDGCVPMFCYRLGISLTTEFLKKKGA